MSKYFERQIVDLLRDAKDKVVASTELAEAKASANGYLLSGQIWLEREQIILNSVKEYEQTLSKTLTNFENDHTPIDKGDFNTAKESIASFSRYCEEYYRSRAENKTLRYPKNRPLFDDDKLERETRKALLNMDGFALVFKSKRSFWKWAWGDARKKAWTTMLVLFFSAVGYFAESMLRVIQNLF